MLPNEKFLKFFKECYLWYISHTIWKKLYWNRWICM